MLNRREGWQQDSRQYLRNKLGFKGIGERLKEFSTNTWSLSGKMEERETRVDGEGYDIV